MSDARPVVFGIVGSGWRSEFFLRIARALPDRFRVSGIVSRGADTRRALEEQWNVRSFPDTDTMLDATAPEFVVVSVPRDVAPDTIAHLAGRGVPVLTETPPAADVAGMLPLHDLVADGAIIQVAEQYHLSPLLAAQLRIAASGRLGRVSQVVVAQCHDYHGVSILRRALGVGFDDVSITATVFDSPLVKGPDRNGDPREEVVVTAHQTTARFDFGDRLGVYDFAPQQYFSWIRANRLLVRGERGEIEGTRVAHLQDERTPMFHEIRRISAGEGGNLEGQFLRGLVAGDEWVYENPYLPGRLNDDEIAIATCLTRMSEHVRGGEPFYSLAEASQDHYLALLMQQAAETGETVRSTRQRWAS